MRICVEFRNTVNSKLLTGISIISCILEVLFFQPFFLFFIFRKHLRLQYRYFAFVIHKNFPSFQCVEFGTIEVIIL